MRRPAPDTLDHMATQGRRPARRTSGGPARQGKPQGKTQPKPQGKGKGTRTPATAKVVFDAPRDAPDEPRVFRLATVPGATPGKWIDAWKKRMPHVRLELVPVEAGVEAGDRSRILAEVDAALLRLPLDDDRLHVIALYDEVPVVVAAADSHLLAVDELTIADLSGEVVIVPSDDVLGAPDLPGTTRATFAPLPTDQAIATAASGVGIVIVPMSLARLHHRKDTAWRPLVDGPLAPVAIAWRADADNVLVDTFVGIVRGRTANSSR